MELYLDEIETQEMEMSPALSAALQFQAYCLVLLFCIFTLLYISSQVSDATQIQDSTEEDAPSRYKLAEVQEWPECSQDQEEEEEDEYDDMPPLIEMARPLEPTPNYLRAKMKLRNPLNLPIDSPFYKAFNGLKTIELNVNQVKEDLLSAKIETDYAAAESRKLD